MRCCGFCRRIAEQIKLVSSRMKKAHIFFFRERKRGRHRERGEEGKEKDTKKCILLL